MRDVVFVEGDGGSLDKLLYSILFPNTSVVAQSSCRDVEQAVVGIKSTIGLSWVQPYGFVDNDFSDQTRIASLVAKGVTPIRTYSIEAVYYHPVVQRLACERHSAVVGGNVAERLIASNEAAIDAIRKSADHLCSRIVEKTVRIKYLSSIPNRHDITSGKCIVPSPIDCRGLLDQEKMLLEGMLGRGDFASILSRYPIRSSPAIKAITDALQFRDRAQYEETVRRVLLEDVSSVKVVRRLLGDLPKGLVDD